MYYTRTYGRYYTMDKAKSPEAKLQNPAFTPAALSGKIRGKQAERGKGHVCHRRKSPQAAVRHAGSAVPGVPAETAAQPAAGGGDRGADRSEEHTYELQSRFDLVCRLLLEKKKKYIKG